MTPTTLMVLSVAQQQAPQDVGKSGPFGLLLLVLLLLATALLVKSMSGHLKRLPRSFDAADREPRVVVPDSPAGLEERREPGQELLDTLRRAPLAIEAPRGDEGDRG
ncbi:hypothetical protein QOZ88_17080 [Blastococcus sp. BMG 814]|uniref:Sec-independent protein translocase protein TatA n=1 Tax=Blastococcus carthaginiensis TaxID=3050034 RepID=A0ABT9IFK7_9ACTN|nr:hypothetical protein [Blastococcus carthaginiensis]MDP5184351.1 hypothetical protein [Blastococcus carthaginiensis]